MSLRDFFSLHHEELLRACNSEAGGESRIEQLARELCGLLDPLGRSKEPEPRSVSHALVGDDPAIKRVRTSIEQLARRSRLPVLFLGEVGTGKRHSARLLHAETYPDGEFFELKSGEHLPLLERKLASLRVPSSASAIGGVSVYVNELSTTSKANQAMLAKLLGEHRLRVRVIASSRLPLTHACREGLLRSDLVFGFSTTVELPNLRDRLADLPALVAHFASLSPLQRTPPLQLSDAALQALAAHAWPGNLTELAQLVGRLQRLTVPGAIEPEHLAELGHRRSAMVVNLPAGGIDLAELERELLLQALALTDNNRSRAARLLGLTRDQIRYRLAKLDVASAAGQE